jgi:hypothetical protein
LAVDVTKNVNVSAFFDPKMTSKFVTILPELNSKKGERLSRKGLNGLGGIAALTLKGSNAKGI